LAHQLRVSATNLMSVVAKNKYLDAE
jgi:hypothetical protein